VKKIISFIVIGVLLGGLGAYAVVRYIAGQRVENEIAAFVEKTPAVERIKYDAVRVGLIRPAVQLKNIQIKLAEYQESIRIDQIDLAVKEQGDPIPSRARAEIRGVHLSTRHRIFQDFGAALKSMGYDDVTGLLTLDYHYEPAKKQLNLNDVTLEVDGMGRLQVELALTNLDLSRLVTQEGQTDIASLLFALPTMGIARGRFAYQDDTFAQRLFRLNAPRSGLNTASDRLPLFSKLEQLLAEEKNERTRQFISIIQKFINHPKSITGTMTPAKSVPLLRFLWVKKWVDLIELLNADISI